MEILFYLVNGGASGLIALALIWAVLTPHVHDGIVIKSGLILMALGFGAIAVRMLDPWSVAGDLADALSRALLLVNVGAAVVYIGYRWRTRNKPKARRRASDFMDLDSRNHA
jgi:hypothetical protein